MKRKQKIEMVKRIIILIGLSAIMIAWTVLAICGAVCLARKFGWLL